MNKIQRYGWIPDLPDRRDFKYSVPRSILDILPPRTDLTLNCPSIYNQQNLGSCFDGETKIPLLNGNARTIKELSAGIEGKQFWVYSSLPTGEMIPALATAKLTRKNVKVIEVVLDNGEKIICTPDHKFMLRDGNYKLAKDLTKEDSLMPWKVTVSKNGYEKLLDNVSGKFLHTYCLVHLRGNKKTPHFAIHHVNFNKKDNTPSNLISMGWREHFDYHSKLGTMNLLRYNGTPAQREHARENALRQHREMKGWTNPSKGGKNAWESARKDADKMKRMLSGFSFGHTPEAREKARLSIIETSNLPENKIKYSITMKKNFEENPKLREVCRTNGKKLGGLPSLKYQIMKFGHSIIKKYGIITDYNWGIERNILSEKKISKRVRNGKMQEFSHMYCNVPKFNTALATFGSLDTLMESCSSYNHNVFEVNQMSGTRDVYCLEVPQYENFAISAGVYVHNCTGNAIAGAHQFEQIKQVGVDKSFIPSRLMIYYDERVMENSVMSDSGAMIRDGIKSVADQGVCSETMWPYDINQFTVKPPDSCYTDGLLHLVTSYLSVDQSLDQMRGCLASGYPFIFGFSVYDSFESSDVAKTGIVNLPRMFERCLGGHAVMCVGYDDASHRFIVRNSWGSSWGQNGYFTIPYAYLTDNDLADDFWTIRLVKAA